MKTPAATSISCPYCGSAAKVCIVSQDRNRRLSCQRFFYHRCPGCGLVFLDPVPADLEAHYAGGYQRIPDTLAELRAMAAPERYRLEPVLEKAGGDLLEIGPWIGLFSINARDAGFRVDAIEMSAAACAFLRDVAGIHATHSSDPVSVLRAPKRYDVIALWHSLEHLQRPWEVLRAAAQRLKPGGILLVAIPNIDGVQAHLLGSRWLHLDAPRHLYFWPPGALANMAQRLGLTTLRLDTGDRLSRVLGRDAWASFIRSAVKVPVVRGIAANTLGPVLDWVTRRAARGAGLTATFRAP